MHTRSSVVALGIAAALLVAWRIWARAARPKAAPNASTSAAQSHSPDRHAAPTSREESTRSETGSEPFRTVTSTLAVVIFATAFAATSLLYLNGAEVTNREPANELGHIALERPIVAVGAGVRYRADEALNVVWPLDSFRPIDRLKSTVSILGPFEECWELTKGLAQREIDALAGLVCGTGAISKTPTRAQGAASVAGTALGAAGYNSPLIVSFYEEQCSSSPTGGAYDANSQTCSRRVSGCHSLAPLSRDCDSFRVRFSRDELLLESAPDGPSDVAALVVILLGAIPIAIFTMAFGYASLHLADLFSRRRNSG